MNYSWKTRIILFFLALLFLFLTACGGPEIESGTAVPDLSGTSVPTSAEPATEVPEGTSEPPATVGSEVPAVQTSEASGEVTGTSAADTELAVTTGVPETTATEVQETTKVPVTEKKPETSKVPETTKAPETTAAPTVPKPKISLTDSSSVIAMMEETLAGNLGVGMQVAVFSGGVLTAEYAAGLAIWDKSHPERNVPMTPSHLIRCASLSKTVLAVCASRMTELGLLDPDAPVGGTYWGQAFPVEFSMRDILTHTSPLFNIEDYYKKSKSETLAQLLSRNNYRFSETGKYYSYNNYAAGIGGATLELILNGSAQAFMEEQFYRDMQSEATWFPGDRQTGTYANLYSYGTWLAMDLSGVMERKDCGVGANCWAYAGGVFTSAGDLAKMYAMLANDGEYAGKRYLQAETVAAMEMPRFSVTEDGITFDQCLILRHRRNLYGQDEVYYHTGSAYGVHALALYNPLSTQGIVVLTNGLGSAKDEEQIYRACGTVADILLNP